MNLPSGEICCPERPLRLSDSVSVGVCLLWAGTGWEPPSKARPVTARASFFKGHLPGDVTLSDEPAKRLVSSCRQAGTCGAAARAIAETGPEWQPSAGDGSLRQRLLGVTALASIPRFDWPLYARHSIDVGKPIVLPIQSPKFTQLAW